MSEQVFTYHDWIVEYEPYMVDGAQVRVREWDGTDWWTRYNKRVLAENQHEAVTGALVECGWDWDNAAYVVEERWNIPYVGEDD